MRRQRKRSLFIRHIAFYAVLVSLPVLIFIAFINNFLIRDLQRQYNNNNRQILRQTVHYTESNLANIQTIKDYLLQERQFPYTRELSDVNKALSIMRNLTKHTISNSFLSDTVLYFASDRYVYTSNSTYSLESFAANYMNIPEGEREAFIKFFAEPREPRIFPVSRFGGARNLVAVLYPMQFRESKASLMFLFYPSFSQTLEPGAMLLTLDEKGEPVFTKNITSEEEPRILREVLALKPESLCEPGASAEVRLGEHSEKYLVMSMKSAYTSWTYVYLSPMSISYSDLYNLQLWFIILVLFVIILSAVLIGIGLKLNYKPVSRLVSIARQYGAGEGQSGEIEQIQNALSYLATENLSLKNSVVDSEKSRLVREILQGRHEEGQSYKAQALELNMPVMQKPIHAVHLLRLTDTAAPYPTPKEIKQLYEGFFPAYVLTFNEQNSFSVLVGLTEEDEASYEASCRRLYELLSASFGGKVLLCLGTLTRDDDAIAQSYHEALMAYEYSFIKGDAALIPVTELEVLDHLDPTYPNQLFNRIAFNLKQGDEEETIAALDELEQYIKEAKISLYYAKGLCYQLIHSVSLVITELTGELKLDGTELTYASALTDAPTVDVIIAKMKRLAQVVCRRVTSAETGREDDLGIRMKAYIDENFSDMNFSVQNMADDFHMPLSSLSLFFKRQNGTTISSYLTTVRMNAAKNLMLNSDLPLNDITQRVGYINPSSFIRKFKSLYGLTPGQWVKTQKTLNDED